MIDPRRFYRVLQYVLIAITAVGAIAWLMNTWCYSDDYCYMHSVIPGNEMQFWLCRGELITAPGQLWEAIVNHHDYINGRLGNFLMFMLILLPRGPVCFVNGLFVAAMLMMMLVLGRLDRHRVSALWICLAVVLLWAAFPWDDQFQSIAFVINYVPTSVLFMLALYSCRRSSDSRRWLWVAMLSAFFTAWMHEGFATVMLAVLFFDFMLDKSRRRPYVLASVAALSGLIICFSTGTVSRAGTALSGDTDYTYWSSWLRLVSQGWPVVVAIVMLVVYALCRPGRWRVTAVAVAPWLAGALVGAVQCEVLMNFERALWPAQLCASIAILVIVSQWRGCGEPTRKTLWVCVAFAGLYAAWLGLVVATQIRIAGQQREYDRLCAEAAAEGSPIVYADLEFFGTSWLACGLARNYLYQYTAPVFINARARHFGFHDEYYITMPARLRGKPFGEWDVIPGTAGLRGQWPFVAGPYMPAGERDSIYHTYDTKMELTFGDPAPSCPLYQRLKLKIKDWLGCPTPSVLLNAYRYPVNIGDTIVSVYFFGGLPARYNDICLERIDIPEE